MTARERHPSEWACFFAQYHEQMIPGEICRGCDYEAPPATNRARLVALLERIDAAYLANFGRPDSLAKALRRITLIGRKAKLYALLGEGVRP
jgi:hypothetical protein